MAVEADMVEFYNPFFGDEQSTREYLEMCYSLENPLPRRIINHVHRLISIGEAAAGKRGGHGIQVAHFVICIESLFRLLFPDEDIEKANQKRLARIKYFFEEYTSPEDKKLLKEWIARSIVDDRAKRDDWGFDNKLELDVIARIFSEVRNRYVHEGIYYEFSFSSFPVEEDGTRTASMNLIKLKEFKKDKRDTRKYEITATYEEVRALMVRSFLNLLSSQLNVINQKV